MVLKLGHILLLKGKNIVVNANYWLVIFQGLESSTFIRFLSKRVYIMVRHATDSLNSMVVLNVVELNFISLKDSITIIADVFHSF